VLGALDRFTELAHALLRIVSGVMFAAHGAQKHLGFAGKGPMTGLDTQMQIGGWLELVGGLLIALGLFTRPAAFLCSGMMAVAYVQFHWKLQLGDQFWPIANGGDKALLYSLVFLLIACRGPGKASLDGLVARKQS
jgi:putative oxidoreductase